MFLTDSARFSPNDDAAVVAASFACPYCLREAAYLLLYVDRDDGCAEARCRCWCCESAWTVALDAPQATRMSDSPPGELLVVPRAVPGGAEAST